MSVIAGMPLKFAYLGIVRISKLLEPEIVPTHPLKLMLNAWLKDTLKVFVPSSLWLILVEPLAKVLEVLFPIPIVFVPEYVEPLIVTLQLLEALEIIYQAPI